MNSSINQRLSWSNAIAHEMGWDSQGDTNNKLDHLSLGKVLLEWNRDSKCSQGVISVHQRVNKRVEHGGD